MTQRRCPESASDCGGISSSDEAIVCRFDLKFYLEAYGDLVVWPIRSAQEASDLDSGSSFVTDISILSVVSPLKAATNLKRATSFG